MNRLAVSGIPVLLSQSKSTNGPKPITLKLSGTIYSTNMYNTIVADNTSVDVLADEDIDRCLKWATIAAGVKLVILW